MITETETGTYELWNQCDSLSYCYLFNIDDGSGDIPNFKGAGKSTNKEFIIVNKYHYGVRQPRLSLHRMRHATRPRDLEQPSGRRTATDRNGLYVNRRWLPKGAKVCYLNVTPSVCSPTNMRAMSPVLYHAGFPGMSSEMRTPLMTRFSKRTFFTLRSPS